jgi:hypothetical protein
MSRLILILLLSAMLSYGILNLSQNDNVGFASQNTVDNYSDFEARNIGNSTVHMLMAKVADDSTWRQTTPKEIDYMNGSATYTVTSAIFNGENLIKFAVNSDYFGTTRNITAYAKPLDIIDFGVAVKSAITTNNDVLTLGTITVDGRDHTASGTLIPNLGTYGVWTTETFTYSGNGRIGGTSLAGIDHVPNKNPDPSIIAEHQSWPLGYPPSTPEEALQTPPGFSFKQYAMSGLGGSQYVTDPINLHYPLSGITYVELLSGDPWNEAHIDGGGILIVHNDSVDAIIKNTYDKFSGLVIADDIIHLHSDIIGAVISLTKYPSEGNTIGNSDGDILYSREALLNVFKKVRPRNFGFAKNRLDVRYWYE